MRFTLPYNLIRVIGILTLVLLLYIIVIGIFGRVDLTPILPIRLAASLQENWPQLPFFTAEKAPGNGNETYYTVPTRQFTRAELARMNSTSGHLTPKSEPSPTPGKYNPVPSPTSAAPSRAPR